MKHWFTTRKLGALAACIAAAGAVAAAPGMNRDAYRTAGRQIDAVAKADHAACQRAKPGDARQLCDVQAKGREQVARARLEAQHKPGPESERRVKEAQADADFALAKTKCALGRPGAKDACLQQAKAQREAAERLAVVEKVQEVNAIKARLARPARTARVESPEEQFKSQKAYCAIQGADRDRCLAAVMRRFHKA